MRSDTVCQRGRSPRHHAEIAPDGLACTRLVRGEEEGTSYTYGELDRRVRAVAAIFQARHARGERALLIFEGGLEPVIGFFGCLYAGVIALPLPAPNRGRAHRYGPRFAAVIKNAGARYIVTTSDLFREIDDALKGHPEADSIEWILLDEVDIGKADDWREEDLKPDEVAYLAVHVRIDVIPERGDGHSSKPGEYLSSRWPDVARGVCRLCRVLDALLP